MQGSHESLTIQLAEERQHKASAVQNITKMGQPSSKLEETINLPIASKFETNNSEANAVSHTFLKWVGAVITIVLLLSLSCFLAYKYKNIKKKLKASAFVRRLSRVEANDIAKASYYKSSG